MIYFDIETTGLDCGPDSKENAEFCRIEAIKCANNAIIDRFSTFVRCNNPIKKEVSALTGITDEMLVDAPDVSAAIDDFIAFAGDDKLVGYNVDFDMLFIRYYAPDAAEFFKDRVIDLFPSVEKSYGEQIRNFQFNDIIDEILIKKGGGRRQMKNALTLENVCRFFDISSDLSSSEALFYISQKLGIGSGSDSEPTA